MNIAVAGCGGRMGRMVVQAVLEADTCALVGGAEQPGHETAGMDLGALVGGQETGHLVEANPEPMFERADAVIDFSAPATTVGHARLAARHGTALVIGTTGLGHDEVEALEVAGAVVPVVRAANMSLGVNLLLGLTSQVAAVLGDDYDIEIIEMHHRHKKDAPSGTALALGDAAAAARNVSLQAVAARVRDGMIGERPRGSIGFATLRGGDVVGEHTVLFAGEGERIELTHRAGSRAVFARGAVHAALWTHGRPPGLYSMRQVLGFE